MVGKCIFYPFQADHRHRAPLLSIQDIFIYFNNRQLVIYGIKKSDKCEFCHMFSEDLMHIFWLCKHVQSFWNTVINWIFFKTKIRLQVNAQTIILGNPNYSKKDSVVNLIILIAKQYIYK